MPLTIEVVKTVSAGLMVILICLVAVCAGELLSDTFTVNKEVPKGPVGVPLIAPPALIDKPAGCEVDDQL